MTAIITKIMTKFFVKNIVISKNNLWVLRLWPARKSWICHFLLWPVTMTGKLTLSPESPPNLTSFFWVPLPKQRSDIYCWCSV